LRSESPEVAPGRLSNGSGAPCPRNRIGELFAVLLLILFAVELVGCPGGRVADVLALDGDPTAGEALYDEHCLACHGSGGVGTVRGPELTGWGAEAATVSVLLDGTEEMESYDFLSDEQLADLLAFMEELQAGL